MLRRLSFVGAVVVLFIAARASAQNVNITGTWSGNYVITDRCDNGQTFSSSGTMTAAFNQNGSAVNGIATINNAIFTDGTNCTPEPAITLTLPVTGTISGGTFSGTFVEPGDGLSVPLTGAVTATSMTISFAQTVTSGTFTLSLTSSQPPDSRLSGEYSGTYSAAISPCCQAAPVPYTGPLVLTLVQTGTAISGGITGSFKGDRGNSDGSCSLIDRVGAIPFTGQINGNTIIVSFLNGPPLTATVSGDSIVGSGAGECNGEFFSFSVTRSTTTTPPNPPVISSFTASPATINVGETSTLSWTTQQSLYVIIDHGVGTQPANGSVRVSPTQTTTYTLSAAGSPGPAIARTTVTVNAAPRVVVSTPPRGMVQLTGQGGGTDAFTLTNIGSAPASVTLAKSGDFFTISTQSVTIAPNSSQTISITGLPQNAGSYDGTVIASGSGADGLGVRVRLLSSAPPAGTVEPRASQSRAEVNAPAGQSASGIVQFTNSGNSTLQGIAVSDVPWMIPQSGIITIGAGQMVSVSYTVDSSKRPDADSPVGAVTGSLSLVFLRGSSTPTVSDNAPGTSQVSVTLVYVVKPGTSPGIPPPLATNEVALFVPGLANRTNATGDFLLSNKITSGTLSDVKLYLLAPGLPSQLATLPNLPGGSSALFPGLLKNVFSASALTGTAQVRTTDVSKISVAGIQTDSSSPSGTFSTALPVLRSDRGASSGGTVVLAGVLKDAGVQTNMYVQELSGTTANVRIESLDAAGGVIESRPTSALTAFGLLEITDATRAGATAARVVNLGPGRIGAFALVANIGAGDSWLITDPGVESSTDGVLIIPLFSAGTAADTYLYGTNRLTSAVSATIDVHGGSRRRAVGRSGSNDGPMALTPEQSFNRKMTTSTGYIRIAAPPNSISAVGRTLRSDPGQRAYGAGLPAIPASSALRVGESKRFAGIDDASATTRAAKSAGTFRSNLMLIETANASAVVRVTLRYTFAAGSTVSARGVSTRDYTVGASQFLLISDVIADVIGAQRATFGDLRNIDMDVEVVSGRIIPVLQSIDNGSDDSNVRVE